MAIAIGDLKTVSALLEAGANVNKVDSDGITPVCCAISNENVHILTTLLNQSANLAVHRESTKTNPLLGLDRRLVAFIFTQCCLLLGACFEQARTTMLLEFMSPFSQILVGLLLDTMGSLVEMVHGDFVMLLIVTYSPVATALPGWSYRGRLFAKCTSFTLNIIASVVHFTIEVWHQRSQPPDGVFPGHFALGTLLRYGGQGEDMMIALWDAGLDLGKINELNQCACKVYMWAVSRGYLRIAQKLLHQGMAVDSHSWY